MLKLYDSIIVYSHSFAVVKRCSSRIGNLNVDSFTIPVNWTDFMAVLLEVGEISCNCTSAQTTVEVMFSSDLKNKENSNFHS